MSWLIDRNRQIPNGLTFHVPEVNWSPRKSSSFHGITEALQRLVEANPSLHDKYPKGYNDLADLVDQYNANICEQMGWTEYYRAAGGGSVPVPFPVPSNQPSSLPPPYSPPSRQIVPRLVGVAEGAETVVEWLASNKDACSDELAEQRAGICSVCPMNGKGGLERYFTIPAANAVRKAYELRRGMKLKTSHDAELGVCEACSCPLRLKVHFKIEDLKVKLGEEVISWLHPNCWILKELYAQTPES